ncbi:MAG TPA: YwbE family protein [Gracilimonas sp.]|uniref:YwbE family protein n=1 Tax=Gracilimonas sp. TaxID=1974203 RepID=UPI002D8D8338|nr:YwbE family protein [Gracilimonas sp.]
MDGTRRAHIKAGMEVGIVLKKDQHSGELTFGTVQKILTNSDRHPYGIKVRLTDGQIGRVKEIK